MAESYPERLEIVPLTKPPKTMVSVPGSKSITNRALVLAALVSEFNDCVLTGALQSDDTEYMVAGLGHLGYRIETDWPTVFFKRHGAKSFVPATSSDVFVGNSGTTMRFLTALCAIGKG